MSIQRGILVSTKVSSKTMNPLICSIEKVKTLNDKLNIQNKNNS